MIRAAVIAFTCATPVVAQTERTDLSCSGVMPDWSFDLTGDEAQLDFEFVSQMTVALTTEAQNADGVRALTLIGRGDTAIVIIEDRQCAYPTGISDPTASVKVLTQRRETPILLVGCCR